MAEVGAVACSGYAVGVVTLALTNIDKLIYLVRNKETLVVNFFKLAEINKLKLRVGDLLVKLKLSLTKIQGILSVAIADEVNDPGILFWLMHLQNSAYIADDIIDRFYINFSNESLKRHRAKYLRDVEKEITTYLEKIISVMDRYGGFHLDDTFKHIGVSKASHDLFGKSEETTSHTSEKIIFGRNNDKVEILDKMYDLTSQNISGIRVVSVVGITGIGKTTLAQVIFHDPEIVKGFIRIWISMQDNFHLDTILKTILESVINNKFENLSSDHLYTEFKRHIAGKYIFLVLDNARHEVRRDWSKLLSFLNCAAEGSFLLITTQSPIVSSLIGSQFEYFLPKLSEDFCWSIFQQSVFPSADYANDHQSLCNIGKQIITKCYGIPLIAKTLGDILYSQDDLKEWKCIFNSELWNLPDENNAIAHSLRLCYNNLPKHLKALVPYFGLLSRSYRFDKDTIVELWMAEEMIQPKGSMQLEDVGYGYFDEFLRRGFFQLVNHNGEDNFKYEVHGFIHDMVRLINIDGSFRSVIGEGSGLPQNVEFLRHVSVDMEGITMDDLLKFKRLRTILVLRGTGSIEGQIPRPLFDFQFVRVLDLSKSRITIVCSAFSNLLQLRYLNISYTPITYIDEVICNLQKLQTLKVRGCTQLGRLPEGLGKCVSIRHLDLDENSAFPTPRDIGMLTNLQELRRFAVSRNGCNIDQLEHLNMLRNSLCISGLQNISEDDSSYGCIREKENLKRLRLLWTASESVEVWVTRYLQPHPNVEELVIEGYPLREWRRTWPWVRNSPSSLQRIEITGCLYLECIVILKGLPCLKTLILNGNETIQNFDPRLFFGFQPDVYLPSLENLSFVSWRNWISWTNLEAAHMPKLGKLSIDRCPALTIVPNFSCLSLLKKIEFIECGSLRISAGDMRPPLLEKLSIKGCPHLGADSENVDNWPFTA